MLGMCMCVCVFALNWININADIREKESCEANWTKEAEEIETKN